MNLEQQHEMVKTSLFQFVNSHIPGADLSVVDEIVLSYVISILEEASQDPSFDVEGFIEMMSAYISDFSRIDPGVICTWIFQLESQLSKLKQQGSQAKDHPLDLSLNSLNLADILPETKLRARAPVAPVVPEGGSIKRVQHLSETSDGGSTDSSSCDFFSEECDALQEMFPESTYLEVKHCITIASGDIDRATQILLHRQESGQSLVGNGTNIPAPKSQSIDDAELKNRIIARYSYVDKSSENREYKPVAPKVEPKKLVRYRDNKIVSLKGERYTEMKPLMSKKP
ncbi:CUE domain-containing protein 2-A [Lutzomyia longipalpis]|uniref:CUE domain-containing protein 2-A n=1 Tax=Lutzomyia longipalpis TaxID=7200 RepID=UPI002483A4E0|nr:CUE domain-containing protein 2-A [Lutzomyia longipalpis]